MIPSFVRPDAGAAITGVWAVGWRGLSLGLAWAPPWGRGRFRARPTCVARWRGRQCTRPSGATRAAVRRRTRLIADRSAGVAVVVVNDEPGAGRETLAELVLPPEHRSGRSVDEEDRGVSGIAEGMDAEVHPVGPDDLLAGPHNPNAGTRRGRPFDCSVVCATASPIHSRRSVLVVSSALKFSISDRKPLSGFPSRAVF
jgi:hypothetical protein